MKKMSLNWKGAYGAKRLQAEFMHLSHMIQSGEMPQVHDLELVGDDLMKWRFKVKNFDEDIPGGRSLNQDLRYLSRKFGQDHLLMEITFEHDYPTTPFFLRLVSPRCEWYTGHVSSSPKWSGRDR